MQHRLIRHLSILTFLLACLGLAIPSGSNLEYEYVIVISWSFVFLYPLVISVVHRFYRYEVPEYSPKILLTLFFLPMLAFIPGWALFAAGQCACGTSGFNLWMMILMVPALWLGLGISLSLIKHYENRKFCLAIYSSLWGWAVIQLAILWFSPQKRIVSLVLGYLHGPIYDRWIPLDWGIVIARLSHGLFALSVILLALRKINLKWIMIAVISLRVWAFKFPSNGHGVTALDRVLSQKIAKKDVVFHFEKKTDRDVELAMRLADDAEFHVAEIKNMMKAEFREPIQIYAYRSDDFKKLIFGGGQTDVTDVWTPTIHIELNESPHGTLRHELVHAVSSYVSWHGIGFHPNMIITEGLAMALAPTEQLLSMDEISASLIHSGRLKSMDSLLSPWGFWSESGERTYAVAGSFMRWIYEAYGAEGIRAIYSGVSLETVTQKSMKETIDGWKLYVSSKHSSRNDLIVEKYSREPGVLNDLCPHTREDLSRPRREGVLTRLRQPIGWDSEDYLPWLMELNPRDRSTRLQLQRKQIGDLLKQNIIDGPGLDVWIESLQKSRAWPPKVVEDIEVNILVSDLQRIAGKIEHSSATLNEIVSEVKVKSPGTQILRQIESRKAIENLVDAREQGSWRRYLAGYGDMPSKSENEPWILSYLRSRKILDPTVGDLMLWSEKSGEAAEYKEIVREWRKMIARESVKLGKYDRARNLYSLLRQSSSGEAIKFYEEQVRRMEFRSKK